VAAIVALILGAVIFAGVSMNINRPSSREFVDQKMLHRSGEFTGGNLGTSVDLAGQVTKRIISTQWAFVPS
jgi:hypothetical protein